MSSEVIGKSESYAKTNNGALSIDKTDTWQNKKVK